MDRIEQQVRDSLQARANDVEPSQDLWDEVNHRITRRQRWRVGAYALAGATAVAVGVLVVPGLLGGLTTPEIEPWSPTQEESGVEEPVGPDEEPSEAPVDEPGDGTAETPQEAEEGPEPIEDGEGTVGPTGVAEPVIVVYEDTLLLLTPGGSTPLVTLPEEGHSWFLSVAVRPGSTVEDLTIVTTTSAEGFQDIRWTRIVDGEVVVPFEAFEGTYAPAASTTDTASISSVVWSPDGGSVAWLDQTPEGTTLRTVGWDDGPGTGRRADDQAGFGAEGLPSGAMLDDWVAIDGSRSLIRATMADSTEGWYGIPMERQADGALAAGAVEANPVPEPTLGPVGAVGGVTQDGAPRWLVRLGFDGALLMDVGAGTQTDLPSDLMPGDGFAELWARPHGDGVLVGSYNTATAYLVVGEELTPISVPARDLAPIR
jgi:hypothetical protein